MCHKCQMHWPWNLSEVVVPCGTKIMPSTESTGHSDETNWDEKTANVLLQVDGAPAAPHRIIPVLTRLECSDEAKAWSLVGRLVMQTTGQG